MKKREKRDRDEMIKIKIEFWVPISSKKFTRQENYTQNLHDDDIVTNGKNVWRIWDKILIKPMFWYIFINISYQKKKNV